MARYRGHYVAFVPAIMECHARGLGAEAIERELIDSPLRVEGPFWKRGPVVPSGDLIRYIIRRETGARQPKRVFRPLEETALERRQRRAGRVIDMGGPRDRWLHFVAGPEAWR